MTDQADTLKNVLVHDPILKAGQDIAGGIADALAIRATKGPLLDYYDTDGAPTELGAAASGEAIYGDTLDVTDAQYLNVEVALFFNAPGGIAPTTNANIAVSLESSGDGISWFPIGVVDRVVAISPATLIRDDNGQTAGALSTTGGFASASTTQNAVMLEDNVAMLPALASAVATPFVVQKAYRFSVPSELYVRVVVEPIYDEPPDITPPSLLIRVNKAAG